VATRTRTEHKPTAVGGDAKVEDWLDSKGVKWTFAGLIEPSSFDADKSLTNQARFVPVDDKRVDEYADAMRRGDVFPPVVAHGRSGRYIIVDGNHRLQAAIKAHKPLGTYLVTADAATLVLLSYEANTRHGLPTSEDERIAQALYLVDNGSSNRIAAATLNLPLRLVDKAVNTRSYGQRFVELNVPRLTIEKLSEPVKRRLAMVNTDEGLLALLDVVVGAKLSSSEVADVVTQINAHRSATKQLAYVEGLREAYADRLGKSGGGVLGSSKLRGAQTPKARAAMGVGTILNLPDDLDAVAKAYAGPERDEARKRFQLAARKLNELARKLA
jgi:hypothetical protein